MKTLISVLTRSCNSSYVATHQMLTFTVKTPKYVRLDTNRSRKQIQYIYLLIYQMLTLTVKSCLHGLHTVKKCGIIYDDKYSEI